MQDEKKKLLEENDRIASETNDLKKEIDELKSRLEETEWGLCQKSGELAHVKSQLKDTQVINETKMFNVGIRISSIIIIILFFTILTMLYRMN